MSLFSTPRNQVDRRDLLLLDPVFIADLHLSADEPDTLKAFLAFLQAFHWNPRLQKAQELVILGDLFDAWIGDDAGVNPLGVMDALADFARTRRLFVMHGNRDFLLGKAFARQVNARLIADPVVAILPDQTRLLLSHGDAWCTRDVRYQAVRRKVRNPVAQAFLLSLPLWFRRRIARNARAKSQATKYQVDDLSLLDVTPAVVAEAARAHHTPFVVHGHTHRPQMTPLLTPEAASRFTHPTHPEGLRVVLADWVVHGNQVERGDYIVWESGVPVRYSLANLMNR